MTLSATCWALSATCRALSATFWALFATCCAICYLLQDNGEKSKSRRQLSTIFRISLKMGGVPENTRERGIPQPYGGGIYRHKKFGSLKGFRKIKNRDTPSRRKIATKNCDAPSRRKIATHHREEKLRRGYPDTRHRRRDLAMSVKLQMRNSSKFHPPSKQEKNFTLAM